MAIEYVINEDIEIISEGAFCIPSKLFTSYIGLVNDDEIEIKLVGSDTLELKTESGNLKLKGIEASEFPLIPTIKEEVNFALTGKTLKKAIEKTLFSAAEGNIRPTLAGVYVNIEAEEAVFASTDSFRLSEYKTQIAKTGKIHFSQIIPSKTMSEVRSILQDNDQIKVVSGDSQIGFFFGNTKIYSRLLNGKFPDYSSFFPKSYSTKAVINRIDLMS